MYIFVLLFVLEIRVLWIEKNKNSQFVCGGPLPPTSARGRAETLEISPWLFTPISLSYHFPLSLKYNFNELTRKRAYFKVNHHFKKTCYTHYTQLVCFTIFLQYASGKIPPRTLQFLWNTVCNTLTLLLELINFHLFLVSSRISWPSRTQTGLGCLVYATGH